MLQLVKPGDIIDQGINYPPLGVDEEDWNTQPWVAVSEKLIRNFEMLYAFRDPMAYGFPTIRVCRILDNNNFIVCGPGFDKDINLGDYRKLGTMYYKILPDVPEDLRHSIFFES